MRKIGFACVYMHEDRSLRPADLKRAERSLRMSKLTHRWMTENPSIAYDRLYETIEHNVNSVYNLVSYVASLPKPMQMVRISSDVLPFYTHEAHRHFYQEPDVVDLISDVLGKAGVLARKHSIKLSFHPGQFCVLASDKPHVIENSIDEFEYHVDLVKWLGFGKKKLDMKVNVHLSGAGGIPQFKKTYGRLSPEARKVITLENDEVTSGIDDILPLHKKVGIVLDIHHHWIHSGGEHIKPNDPRMDYVHASWRGARPTIHYSYSRAEYMDDWPQSYLPCLQTITETTPKGKLRAHSDYYPHALTNRWALGFLPMCDIMCEAKFKNLASLQLYYHAKQLGLV